MRSINIITLFLTLLGFSLALPGKELFDTLEKRCVSNGNVCQTGSAGACCSGFHSCQYCGGTGPECVNLCTAKKNKCP